MDQARFVEKFGSIFEHSPWVAEEACLDSSATSDAESVHAAMVSAFRAGGSDKRMAVLLAHPDLAGKLAQAKKLTAASTSEQASAGLDALTDEERELFTRQNRAYVEKFGFPFIIAVRDNTKASIVDAFEKRLENSASEEFDEACRQVERIAWHRLKDMLG